MTRSFFLILLSIGLISCSGRPTHYTIDPEVSFNQSNKVENKTAMVEVIPPASQVNSDQGKLSLNADNDFAKSVKQGLIDGLIKSGYKISSNKHFSDVVIRLNFSEFSVVIEPSAVSDEIIVKGNLAVELTRKPKTFRKTFSRSQQLIVVGQANDSEVTGLTNDVVGKLLATALTDDSVQDFISQNMQ